VPITCRDLSTTLSVDKLTTQIGISCVPIVGWLLVSVVFEFWAVVNDIMGFWAFEHHFVRLFGLLLRVCLSAWYLANIHYSLDDFLVPAFPLSTADVDWTVFWTWKMVASGCLQICSANLQCPKNRLVDILTSSDHTICDSRNMRFDFVASCHYSFLVALVLDWNRLTLDKTNCFGYWTVWSIFVAWPIIEV